MDIANAQPELDLDCDLPSQRLGGWLRAHGEGALSSNVGASDLAFQRWFKFKEAYSPKLVIDVIESCCRPVRRCIDPTGGSGTTALACSFADIECETIEVNPFLADLITAKTRPYDTAALEADFARLLAAPAELGRLSDINGAPSTLIEPGDGRRWVFGKDVALRVLAYSRAIEEMVMADHRPLARVLLGSVLRGVSNVVVNGKGRKYRRGWERRAVVASDVTAALKVACKGALQDLARYGARRSGRVDVRRGDARALIRELAPADCAIFSPPYPNSFDYTDIYNLELWMLGYLRSPADNRELRLSTMHSHVQLGRPTRAPASKSETFARTLAAIEAKRSELWHRDIPGMLSSYFADLEGLVVDLKSKVLAGGSIAVVVGASSYAGLTVDAPKILEELGVATGLTLVERRSIRSMRLSAQQGGREGLSEDIVIFKA